MSGQSCIFCKIAKGEVSAHKIYEDKEFLAFLDINPNVYGMTILVTKEHYPSYLFGVAEDVYERMMETARKVARLLDEKLDVQRTAMVMEGMGINHAHIKLYPLHGLDENFQEMWSEDRVYFDKYPGYVTTKLGPEAEQDELETLAEKIRD
ncbi:MAG: HIT family protein [Patescibacteria group bacterium]